MSKIQQMASPWIMYPEIPLGSIGWRMGYGEGYWDEYSAWLSELSEDELSEHEKLFPKPICWSLDHDTLMSHDHFWIYDWKVQSKYNKNKTQPDTIVASSISNDYIFFWGHTPSSEKIDKSCLSQWYPSKFRIGVKKYFCMEQYMMANKAELFDDNEIEKKIMSSNDPKEIKELGRQIKGFDKKLWDKFKLNIVMTGNYYKFVQNPELYEFLLSTGENVLVEASPYDTIWGIGLSETDEDAKDPAKWKGQNLLGLALMNVRAEINRVWGNRNLLGDLYYE